MQDRNMQARRRRKDHTIGDGAAGRHKGTNLCADKIRSLQLHSRVINAAYCIHRPAILACRKKSLQARKPAILPAARQRRIMKGIKCRQRQSPYEPRQIAPKGCRGAHQKSWQRCRKDRPWPPRSACRQYHKGRDSPRRAPGRTQRETACKEFCCRRHIQRGSRFCLRGLYAKGRV